MAGKIHECLCVVCEVLALMTMLMILLNRIILEVDTPSISNRVLMRVRTSVLPFWLVIVVH